MSGAPAVERRVVAVVCLLLVGSCAGAALGGAVAQLAGLAPLLPACAGTLVTCIALVAALRRRLARHLPGELDGWFARRRRMRWLWAASALLALVNTARLGWFAADPSQLWASAFPPVPESAQHQCVAAYVRAGELAAAGKPNLWQFEEYDSAQWSEIVGIWPYLGDPYEYPPAFAVLPRIAVAATDDYQLLRDLWFGISGVGFLAAFIALAMWMRGRAGATALLLLPAVALSFPFTLGLQFGQAHLVVVAAAVAAMMQFARRRTISGAVLLAFAISTKIFPGLLLVHLAVRRQWRDIAATLVAVAAMAVLAALVLGSAPLAAFVSEHVPRMASGEAFAFTEDNPDNHSLYGIAFKLAALGVSSAGRELAALLAWIWTAVAVALAIHGSRVRGEPSRAQEVVLWLAIICIATLRSPFAPTYTAIGTLWLLAIAVAERGWSKVFVAVAWLLLQGAPPLGDDAVNAIVSLPGQLVTIAVAVMAVWPARRARASVG